MNFTRFRFPWLASLLVAMLLSACQHVPRPARVPQPAQPVLILVSIDGFRADYLERGLTPNLVALASEGVRAEAMRPSFPSLTFPNHYSIITGLVPDHHGIVHNVMTDAAIPDQRFSMSNRAAVENAAWWNDGQPLWNTARAAGLRSATMFWPGSEAPVRGQQPDYWFIFDQDRPALSRVQQVLDWLDLPAGERPHFITLYFDEVDHLGHLHGPDSDEVNQAMADVDRAMGVLLEGLQRRGIRDEVNLVVVSDHGMATMPAGQVVVLDEHVPADAFRLLNGGPVAGLEALTGRSESLERAIASIPHAQCWRKDRIPARLRYGSHARIPDWVCMADEGWSITDSAGKRRYQGRPGLPGAHGFDPTLASMAALFIARGPDFRGGLVVPGFDNVDVYPLLARLLRIRPEPNDGDPDATRPLLRADFEFDPADRP